MPVYVPQAQLFTDGWEWGDWSLLADSDSLKMKLNEKKCTYFNFKTLNLFCHIPKLPYTAIKFNIKKGNKLGMVAYTCNSSAGEAEAGGSPWAT